MAATAALGVLLAGCDGPIVARSPEALYALAKEQIAHASYSPAVDTLARVVRESPQSEPARRAQVLHIALLGGMARGYKDVGESYLAGHRQAGAAPYVSQMRGVAMDYFGRARGRSIEMVEALDRLLREPATHPLRLDLALPQQSAESGSLLDQVRRGNWIKDDELIQVEREEVRRGLAEMLARVTDAGEDVSQVRERFRGSVVELDPAAFYLGLARELVDVSSIYGPEALRDRRMFRLYHERAAAAAERAAQLAQEKGDRRVEQESERILRRCREVLSHR